MLPVTIAGMGACLPEQKVRSADLEQQLGLAPGWIERLTGVRERRRARDETTVGMAARAARQAIEQAGLALGDIDLIVGACTAPQQAIPCTAALVQRELGLPDGDSFCFDVNATCISFLVALDVAARSVASGQSRQALVFSSEITGPCLNPAEPESYVLMGDGAAAAILIRSENGAGIHRSRFTTHSSGADLTRCLGGGTLHHPNDPATLPEMNYFHMKGPAVYRLAARILPEFVDTFLGEVGWSREQVRTVVPHQASAMGVRLLVSRCGFAQEQLVLNLQSHGNCVAASLPLALCEGIHQGRIRRGDPVLLIGTGAGLSLGAMALTY